MPSEPEHTRAAEQHYEAYEHALNEHPGWAAVMLFYSALHRLEAAFARHNVHNRNHDDRRSYLRQVCRPAYAPYARLQNESLKVRYMQGGLFSLDPKRVENELRKVVYERVCRAADEFKESGPPADRSPSG